MNDSPELLEKLFMDKLPSNVRRIVVAIVMRKILTISPREQTVYWQKIRARFVLSTLQSNSVRVAWPGTTQERRLFGGVFKPDGAGSRKNFQTPNPCHAQLNGNTRYTVRIPFSSTPRLPPARRLIGPSKYHQSCNSSTSCLSPRHITQQPGYCYYYANFGPSTRNC